MNDVMGIMLVIAVVATVVIVGRKLLMTQTPTGRRSRQRAEREGDYGPEGLKRAEERRTVE